MPVRIVQHGVQPQKLNLVECLKLVSCLQEPNEWLISEDLIHRSKYPVFLENILVGQGATQFIPMNIVENFFCQGKCLCDVPDNFCRVCHYITGLELPFDVA